MKKNTTVAFIMLFSKHNELNSHFFARGGGQGSAGPAVVADINDISHDGARKSAHQPAGRSCGISQQLLSLSGGKH